MRQQLIDFYNANIATPWIAAERGYIDAVIEPSRPGWSCASRYICCATSRAAGFSVSTA